MVVVHLLDHCGCYWLSIKKNSSLHRSSFDLVLVVCFVCVREEMMVRTEMAICGATRQVTFYSETGRFLSSFIRACRGVSVRSFRSLAIRQMRFAGEALFSVAHSLGGVVAWSNCEARKNDQWHWHERPGLIAIWVVGGDE